MGIEDGGVNEAIIEPADDDADWERVFQKIHAIIRPNGSVWITDMVSHNHPAIQGLMRDRYQQYLTRLGGKTYSTDVLAYIEQEDSPRSIAYQINLLRNVGFEEIEVLHVNTCFAAFGAIKSGESSSVSDDFA